MRMRDVPFYTFARIVSLCSEINFFTIIFNLLSETTDCVAVIHCAFKGPRCGESEKMQACAVSLVSYFTSEIFWLVSCKFFSLHLSSKLLFSLTMCWIAAIQCLFENPKNGESAKEGITCFRRIILYSWINLTFWYSKNLNCISFWKWFSRRRQVVIFSKTTGWLAAIQCWFENWQRRKLFPFQSFHASHMKYLDLFLSKITGFHPIANLSPYQ